MIDFFPLDNPYGLTQEDGVIKWHGQPVTNYTIEAVKPFWGCGSPDVPDAAEITLRPRYGPQETVLIRLTGSPCKQIRAWTSGCEVLQPNATSVLDSYLRELVHRSVEPGSQCYYADQTGLCRPDGQTWAYVTGGDVLGAADGQSFRLGDDVAGSRLVWDPALDERRAAAHVLKEIEGNPEVLLPVIGYTLISAVRSALGEMPVSTFPALFIEGHQGYGKTVLAQRYCLLYAPAGQPLGFCHNINLDSTAASIREQLSGCRDRVFLIDDLPKSTDAALERERTRRIADILRFFSNNAAHTKCQGQRTVRQQCLAGLVFTGETGLRAASEITRIVHVVIKKPLREGSPSDRTCNATVLRGWLRWLLPQLDSQLEPLGESLLMPSDAQDARLDQTFRMLFWGVATLCQYALERRVVDKAYARAFLDRAKEVFADMKSSQERAVQKITCPAPAGNLSYYILEAYRQNKLQIVKKKLVRSCEDCTVDDNDILYIQSDWLADYLNRHSPFTGLTSKSLGKRLRKEGVFEPLAEGRSGTARINGHRRLALPLTRLKECAVKY